MNWNQAEGEIALGWERGRGLGRAVFYIYVRGRKKL